MKVLAGSGCCAGGGCVGPASVPAPSPPHLPPVPQGELDLSEPERVGDLDECFFPLPNTAVSLGTENFLCEMEGIPFNPVRSWLKQESSQGEGQGFTYLISSVCFRGRKLSFPPVFLPRYYCVYF